MFFGDNKLNHCGYGFIQLYAASRFYLFGFWENVSARLSLRRHIL